MIVGKFTAYTDGKTLSIGTTVETIVPIVVILALLVVGFVVWRKSKTYQTVTVQGLLVPLYETTRSNKNWVLRQMFHIFFCSW